MVGWSGWGCDLVGVGVGDGEASEYLMEEEDTLAENKGVGGSSALASRASLEAFLVL